MSKVAQVETVRTDIVSDTPAYVLGLGNAVALRLAAYSVLLAFLAAGVFSELTLGTDPGRASFD
jgi:hypothetical protein